MNKLNGKITKSATLRGALTRGAGGGTYVEANPEGEATDILEKLMIEDTIYNVRNVPDASSAHKGDVLTKIASGVAWLPQTKELPTYTSGDNGKVLKIINGSPAWAYPIEYSINEHIVGTWIDGKPVYEKVINLDHMPSRGSVVNYPLNITNLNQIIKCEVFCNDGTTTFFIPNVSRGNIAAQTSMYATSTHLTILSGSSSDVGSNSTGYAIIQYTKVGE